MDKRYQELFFGEAYEYLKEINNALIVLEKNPQDEEAINLIFRHMHTLKGMAQTIGYHKIGELAHALEDVFDSFRRKEANITAESMDIIFSAIDILETSLDELKEGKEVSVDIPSWIEKIKNIIPLQKENREAKKVPSKKKKEEEPLSVSEKIQDIPFEEGNIYQVKICLSSECIMKGPRAMVILNRLKGLGKIVKVIPSEDELKREKFEDSFEIFISTDRGEKVVEKELSKILEIEKYEVLPISADYLRKEKEKKEKAIPYLRKIQSMRIPVERLDKIMNLMGELSIAKSRLLQTVQTKEYQALEETAYLIERLVSALQDEALKMRLLPISYLLDNFPRIVRDLARKEDKEVDLEIEGSQIELDRVVLDEIGDPLIHLIRNAIDHGIESPQERAKLGKPPRGRISIKVSREKGHIIIEISDDGRGIDFKEIVKRAKEKGLISQEELSLTEPRQILDILTTPGFSTSEKVTDVSGRGVGLDVVRNRLDALGGRLDLETTPGKGTKFILTLPLTLAIIKAMLVALADQIYAIPLMNIRETVKVNRSSIQLIKDVEVIRLRDEIIPLIRLHKEFGIASEDKEFFSIVIVEGRAKSIGLVVDKVIGEQDIVVKPLGSFVKKIKGIAGATILGDGRVALILDVVNIV